jgi:predicted house-cleaning noncanonical NTP pyrophosphatase (MazG superfamily)
MDYTKSVMSLLHKFQAEGVKIVEVFDGESWETVTGDNNLQIRKNATEIINSVDTCSVRIKYKGSGASLLIVLGNEESEILSDYNGDQSSELWEIIERISEEFSEQWE